MLSACFSGRQTRRALNTAQEQQNTGNDWNGGDGQPGNREKEQQKKTKLLVIRKVIYCCMIFRWIDASNVWWMSFVCCVRSVWCWLCYRILVRRFFFCTLSFIRFVLIFIFVESKRYCTQKRANKQAKKLAYRARHMVPTSGRRHTSIIHVLRMCQSGGINPEILSGLRE